MRAAAYSWRVEPITSDAQFWSRLEAVFDEACNLGVEHLVLPESLVLELAALFPDLHGEDLIRKLASLAAEFEDRVIDLARRTVPSVVCGSHFEQDGAQIYNVSLHVSGEHVVRQRKNVMTQFELVDWGVSPSVGLRVSGLSGTLICYDSEFPEAGRAAAEAGALLLNVPAFTETQRGFQRVRWCGQARAVENQVFVIHASLVGGLGREPVPSTYGSSAILCPSVVPFPTSAVLAETELNQPGFAIADLDFDMLLACREQDDVRNWHDRHSSDWRIEPAP